MSARFEACFKTVVDSPDILISFRLVEDFNLDNSVNTCFSGKKPRQEYCNEHSEKNVHSHLHTLLI